MLLHSHPTGNSNFRNAASAFFRHGLLHSLHSSICLNSSLPLLSLLPCSLRHELCRRSFPAIPLSLQFSHYWPEVVRLFLIKVNLQSLVPWGYTAFSVDRIYHSFDKHVSEYVRPSPLLSGVYAYEDGAFATFSQARSYGLTCIYELPIGYWRKGQEIFEEEAQLNPDWSSTLTGLADSSSKLLRKDEELSLADAVVVPSRFVESSLRLFSGLSCPVFVVPYGSPAPLAIPPITPEVGPLRVLFVGSLSQRKGISYLIEAVNLLGKDVSLTLVGRKPSVKCDALDMALEKFRWFPSLTNSQVLELMSKHDVLVLPSLFEGMSLVLSEALSCGLPIIATPNTGASDLITHGVHGFIVPIRNSRSIASCLSLLTTDRSLLFSMRSACLALAANRSWYQYGELLMNNLRSIISI